MYKFIIAAVVCSISMLAAAAKAHEWTPTYPTFEPSFMDGIAVTTMKIFNKRTDANFYEISVYDEEWNEIRFASSSKIIELDYLEQKSIELYVLESDCDRVEYICSKSLLLKNNELSSGVNTRICSRN